MTLLFVSVQSWITKWNIYNWYRISIHCWACQCQKHHLFCQLSDIQKIHLWLFILFYMTIKHCAKWIFHYIRLGFPYFIKILSWHIKKNQYMLCFRLREQFHQIKFSRYYAMKQIRLILLIAYTYLIKMFIIKYQTYVTCKLL